MLMRYPLHDKMFVVDFGPYAADTGQLPVTATVTENNLQIFSVE